MTKNSGVLDENWQRYKPYLNELKGKLLHILVVFVTGGVIGFIFYQNILSFLMGLFRLEGINLVLTSPYQFIDLAINTGLLTGFVLAFPVFLYYLIQFIKPALRPKEYRLVIRLLPFSIILFIAGFVFGTWVTQYVINIFSKTTSEFAIDNIWDLSRFFSQIMLMGISLALVFQMPIVLTGLLKLKLIKYQTVVNQRRYIYAFLLLFAALLPPTDLLSLVLLTMIPLFLFEITLLLNKNPNIIKI